MNQKTLNIILGVVVLIVIGIVVYFTMIKNPEVEIPNNNNVSTSTPVGQATTTLEYRNMEYGFSAALPLSWKGYTIIEDEWEGYSLNVEGEQVPSQKGPLVSIRHPEWDYKSPRQDIPVMVFTKAQWQMIQEDEFHIGAAPVNPSELGRNALYVFALPARYNFAYLPGTEEVQNIIDSKSIKGF